MSKLFSRWLKIRESSFDYVSNNETDHFQAFFSWANGICEQILRSKDLDEIEALAGKLADGLGNSRVGHEEYYKKSIGDDPYEVLSDALDMDEYDVDGYREMARKFKVALGAFHDKFLRT